MQRSAMLKIVLAVLVLAVLAGGGLYLYRSGRGPKDTYLTAPVTRGSLATTVTSTGTLNPVVTVQVGTPVSGTVKAIYVDYNSPVTKDQPIAQIDPATFKAQVAQTYGNYLAAQANLEKAKVTLADAERTYKRYKNLVSDGSVSVSDYDTAATTWKSSQAAVEAAAGSVEQAKGAYEQAKTNLEYSTIRSPVDGTVISRNVDVGQTVAASFQTPTMFLIAQDLTKMEIDTSVDEADIGRIKEGGVANFTVDSYPEARFQGQVVQVRNAPVTVQNVVTYVVVVSVDNHDLRLKPGMTANVTFVTEHKDDVLKIPAAALRFKPRGAESQGARPEGGKSVADGKRVYVLQDGRAVPVNVATGIGNDAEVEITKGLTEGQQVVVEQTGGKKQSSAPTGGGMGPRF